MVRKGREPLPHLVNPGLDARSDLRGELKNAASKGV